MWCHLCMWMAFPDHTEAYTGYFSHLFFWPSLLLQKPKCDCLFLQPSIVMWNCWIICKTLLCEKSFLCKLQKHQEQLFYPNFFTIMLLVMSHKPTYKNWAKTIYKQMGFYIMSLVKCYVLCEELLLCESFTNFIKTCFHNTLKPSFHTLCL